jgi:uncharacterized protein (TIGR03435 family)
MALLWLIPMVGEAQAVPSRSFEVASVRASQHGCGMTSISPWGATRFTATNASMMLLLGIAFGVSPNHVSAKTDWLETQCYDIDAKSENDLSLSYEQVHEPLQQLLKQRFQLRFHYETREVNGYALVVAKGGSRLQRGKDIQTVEYILPDGLRGESMSMSSLAAMLASPTGRTVIDKTGITGNYNIDLKYAPSGATDSQYPSVFTAVQEQLGLKLELQKVPVEMLVIDHLEKMPTEN